VGGGGGGGGGEHYDSHSFVNDSLANGYFTFRVQIRQIEVLHGGHVAW